VFSVPLHDLVLICGDRRWTDWVTIWRFIEGLSQSTVILEGGCSGADRIANRLAMALARPVITDEAEWGKYGFAAGPIRNRKMLDRGPSLVVAFHNNINKSRGTKNCIEEARRRGIPVWVLTEGF
jgi:hypothetical protein